MKLIRRVIFAGVFLGLLLPFTILKNEDGSTLMSWSDIKIPQISMPSLPSLPSMPKIPSLSQSDSSTDSDKTVKEKDLVYRWYDNDGVVQYTSAPPAEGVDYTFKEYDPNKNVVKSVKIQERAPAPEPEVETAAESGGSSKTEPEPYSAEGIKNLIDEAGNVQELLNKRLQGQKSAINQ